MRVVLTGGAGFVGGAIAAALVRRGDRVVAIVRGRRRAGDVEELGGALDEVGFGLVHVEDLAAGILAALDRGAVGRSYVLSGPTTTIGAAIDLAADLGGTRPPRFRVPTRLLRATAALGRLVGRPNLAEVIAASDGVTYWASARRANDELGWAARPIEAGLRDTFRSA